MTTVKAVTSDNVGEAAKDVSVIVSKPITINIKDISLCVNNLVATSINNLSIGGQNYLPLKNILANVKLTNNDYIIASDKSGQKYKITTDSICLKYNTNNYDFVIAVG